MMVTTLLITIPSRSRLLMNVPDHLAPAHLVPAPPYPSYVGQDVLDDLGIPAPNILDDEKIHGDMLRVDALTLLG